METLDQQILQLIGRYRVAVRSTLTLLTDDGGVPEPAIARLTRQGMVARSRALAANHSVYQLTKKGAAQAGVSEARARSFQAQALFKHLGILLFCHIPGARRFRVEESELQSLLGEPLPEGAHVMTVTNDAPLLLNLYVPGPRTSIRSIQRRVREQFMSARKLTAVRLLEARTYGYAIVTETAERRKAILAMLRQPERDGARPLAKQVRICVEALPEFDRLLNGVSTAAHDTDEAAASPDVVRKSTRDPERGKSKRGPRNTLPKSTALLFQSLSHPEEDDA